MRLVKEDAKRGLVELVIEDLDDLWHLSQVLSKEDTVRSLTYRREEVPQDQIRAKRGEKKRMVLTIEVDSVEFHDFTEMLRVGGIITEGPQDHGSHHTFNLQVGDKLTIMKEWNKWEMDRIAEAVEGKGKQKVLFISVEDDNIVLAELFGYGVKEKATFSTSGGKMEGEGPDRRQMYDEVVKVVRYSEIEGVVVVGPGFFKEVFLKRAREKEPDVFENAILVSTGQGGMSGVREALSKGFGKGYLKEARLARDSEIVGTLMEEIAKNEKGSYGFEETRKAINMGAVELLLVTENFVRKEGVQDLLERTEEMQGEVHIVSSRSEPGELLESLGGMGAILRFPLGGHKS